MTDNYPNGPDVAHNLPSSYPQQQFVPPYAQQGQYYPQPGGMQQQYVPPPPYNQTAPSQQAPYVAPPTFTETAASSQRQQPSSDAPNTAKFEDVSTYMELNLRRSFIRKVFLLMFSALAINLAFTATSIFYPPLGEYIWTNTWLQVTSMVVPIVVLIPLICFRKRTAIALPLFYLFALAYSPMLAGMAYMDPYAATTAVFGVTIMVASLTFVSMLKCVKIGYLGMGVMAIALAYPIIWISMLWMPYRAVTIAYSSIGLVASGVYFLFDLKLTMQYTGFDDAVFAAIKLYMDVVMMFVYLFQLISAGRR